MPVGDDPERAIYIPPGDGPEDCIWAPPPGLNCSYEVSATRPSCARMKALSQVVE